MQTGELIKKLTQIDGVSGDEFVASSLAASLVKPYAVDTEIDCMGNVIAVISKPNEGKPNILLDAHIDRIGMIVTEICDGGFLRVAPCGGVDKKVLPAQRVCIHSKKPLYGVVTAMPPHLQTSEEMKKAPTFDNLFIDTGFSKEEAEKLISQGNRVTVISEELMLLNNRYCTGAIDDRAGVASIIRAVELLSECELDFGLTVLFSVQEETGERGAKAVSMKLDYDEIIAVDVSFAYTPDAKKHKCGEFDKGVMIGIAPSLSKEISDKFILLAKQNNISYQLEIMSGTTGTNADELGVGGSGAKTGLLSIPLRYMHTPYEVISIDDVDSVSALLVKYLENVGGSQNV